MGDWRTAGIDAIVQPILDVFEADAATEFRGSVFRLAAFSSATPTPCFKGNRRNRRIAGAKWRKGQVQ